MNEKSVSPQAVQPIQGEGLHSTAGRVRRRTGSRNPWWWALLAIISSMWFCTVAAGFPWIYLGWSLFYSVAIGAAYAGIWAADRIEEGRSLVPWHHRRRR